MILIENKKSVYHICYSKDALEAVRYSGSELSRYLYLSTDCCIGVFCDKCAKRGPEIILGNTRNNNYDEYLADLSDEGFIIRTINEDIIIHGKTPRAILYGVYYFLEVFIGFRCFKKNCERILKKEIISFDKLDIRKDFSFEYREVYYTNAFDGDFASKNMLNSNLADISVKHGGRTKWYNFHHSFSDLINPEEYFDNHPEYFSMINGERIKEHTELCLSNPDVYRIVFEKVKKWINDNPDCDVFSVAQDEWMGHFTKMGCECENCKRIDDKYKSQSGSIINFVNKLAKDLEEEFPNKLIHTFAYQYTRKAPKGIIPHKNIIVRLTNIECSWGESIQDGAKRDPQGRNSLFLRDLIEWSKITNRLYIWDYTVNYRNYLLPFPCFKVMYKNIKLYKKYHIKGILMQGNFSFGGNGYFDDLKSYVISRLITDDERELKEIIREYCDFMYGKASSLVIKYLFLWENKVKGKTLWLYDDADSPLFDDETVGKARDIINKALIKVKNDKNALENVKILELGLRYLEIVRSPLDKINRNVEIEAFEKDIRQAKITELFERTDLDYSINIMKSSRYCSDRPDWYSLYYVMK